MAGALVVLVVILAVVFVWKPFGGDAEQRVESTARGFSATITSGWSSDVPDGDTQRLLDAWNGDAAHPNSDPIDCEDERRAFKASVFVREDRSEEPVNRQPGQPFNESSGTGLVSNSDGFECGERIQVWTWEEQGRRLQAGVVVGADGASGLPDAYAILNSLRIDPQTQDVP
jgi:hypothetical protein